mgnify:CR=1 FL=1
MLIMFGLFFWVVTLLLVAVTIISPSWRWPVGLIAAIEAGLVSLILFSRGSDRLGLAIATLFTLCFTVYVAAYCAVLFWWHRRTSRSSSEPGPHGLLDLTTLIYRRAHGKAQS